MTSPTTVELLWGIQQRPKRGPKPALSLERIVAEAIALADAEGLANLSMQRLADRLGFTKMSLYRYASGKEQLMALMLDTAIGLPPDITATMAESSDESWRTGLAAWAETIFERYVAHPWTIEVSTGVRPIGPNEMAWTESALVALKDTGLTGSERLDTIVLINGHSRSMAQQISSPGSEDLTVQFAAMMTAAGDRYPEVIKAFTEESSSEAGQSDNALKFGIARVLDGVAVLIAQRRQL